MNHRSKLAFFTLALAAAMPAAAPLAANQLGSAEPIDMALERAALTDVLQSFAAIAGARLDLDPDVEGEVTIELRSVPWVEALDRICRRHELFCAVLPGEPPILSVRPVDPDAEVPVPAGFAQAINLALQRADLGETLHSFGAIAGTDVRIGDEVQGSVTLDVRGAPWPLILIEVCRLNGCRPEWGEQGFAIESAGEVPIFNMSLASADLEETLRNFAHFGILGSSELEVEIAPGVAGTVTVELERVTWQQALGIICDQLDCAWSVVYGDPPTLEVFPAKAGKEAAPGVEEPAAAAETVSYRFTPPGGPPVDGTATFTWAEPIHVLAPGGPYRARLTWIPFGPELSVLLPLIEKCEGAQASVSVLDPIVLPLEETVRHQVEGAVLDLAPAAGGAAGPDPGGRPAASCGPRRQGDIRVSVNRRAEGRPGPRPKRRQSVESYLLVRPVEAPDPVAAVISLGGGLDGRRSLALLLPTGDRRGVDIETLSLGLGETVVKTVVSHGHAYDLAMDYLEQR